MSISVVRWSFFRRYTVLFNLVLSVESFSSKIPEIIASFSLDKIEALRFQCIFCSKNITEAETELSSN